MRLNNTYTPGRSEKIGEIYLQQFSIAIDISGTKKKKGLTLLHDTNHYITIIAGDRIREQLVNLVRELQIEST